MIHCNTFKFQDDYLTYKPVKNLRYNIHCFVSQPSSARLHPMIFFLLNTLCDAVFVLSTLVTGLNNSVIVGNNSEYLSNLTNWIKPIKSDSDWKLCWRVSRDGWDSSRFHSLCDEKGPTITIVKVGKYIFGGYTSLSWSKYSSLSLSV